ncbi:AraC family transcriptional regulator [Flavobacterium aquiphilum]|uniref:AraC family transcriptional regulator n=1 Tax=Flavobacterium aquiphilum TaxID=3003261 RepID=UPI0024802D05|nr:helix-turn-helix domain-containing protein [Flavobacterium aquiphilum]
MNYSLSELLSYFGGFLGLLLFIVTLSSCKKSAIKYSLALFLIVWSAVMVLGALIYSGKVIHFIHIFRLDSPMHFLLGPTVYLFTLSLLNPEFRLKKSYLFHLLPFILNGIYFLPFYLNTAEFKIDNYEHLIAKGSVIMPIQYLLKTISMSAYFTAQLFLYKKYQKSKSSTYQVSWFILYFTSQFILTTGSLIDHFSGLHYFGDPYRFAINIITFFLYSIMIGLLFFPSLLYGNRIIEKETKEKYSHSKLSNEVKETILCQLNDYMKGNDKPYLNENLQLDDIAKMLKASSQQVSQVINEKMGFNFNDFVNAHRIDEAKMMLLSDSYSNITIDAIAQKSGFRSKSAFYTAFKKHTGNTPKEYIANTAAHSS